MRIADIMSDKVTCISPQDSLATAIELMDKNKISCVIVTEDGLLKGIVTERDVVHYANKAFKNQPDHNPLIRDAMSKRPVFLGTETPLNVALAITHSHHFRHLPVTNENEHVVGIVTQSDIVEASIELISQRDDLENAVKELKSLSLEDPLLNIPNRRAMEADLNFTHAFSIRNEQAYSVALLDIDYFKKYNDCYGHQAGDETLKLVSSALNKAKRDSDRLFRYGGEEFLVLMPNTTSEGALISCERLRAAVEALKRPHEESHFGFVTISAGFAQNQSENWEESVKRADDALYEAKEAGRNQTKFHNPNTHS